MARDTPADPGRSAPGDPPRVAGWLTPSDVLEYLYCPRFIYYERVLGIPEHQELRPKVQFGRELHEHRKHENVGYLRKRLGCVHKELDVELHSEQLGVSGRVDEVLFLDGGDAAPLDYKFAEWPGQVYQNLRVQSTLYALLIREAYSVPVTRGYLVYVRGGHHIEEVSFGDAEYDQTRRLLDEVREVLMRAAYPRATRWGKRCPDCCYRNICPR